MPRPGLEVTRDDATGRVASVKLYGEELLDASAPCESELWVNGLQLRMRPHVDPNHRGAKLEHLKGERWVDQTAGWALVLAREMGERAGMKHRCFGVQTLVRREIVDLTCPDPGPGGPARSRGGRPNPPIPPTPPPPPPGGAPRLAGAEL